MIIDLWSVPVYKESTDYTWSRLTQEQKNQLQKLEEDSIPDHDQYTNDGKGKSTKVVHTKGRLLEDPIFKEVRDFIFTHALIYKNNIMLCSNDLELQSSWFTVNKKDQKHDLHKHRHTIFSVCYYPKATSGDLILEVPEGKNSFMKDYTFGFQYTDVNNYNCSMWKIPINSGDVVIFPGYVIHGTTENESDDNRYMIGANFWLRGDMQFIDQLDRINV